MRDAVTKRVSAIKKEKKRDLTKRNELDSIEVSGALVHARQIQMVFCDA